MRGALARRRRLRPRRDRLPEATEPPRCGRCGRCCCCCGRCCASPASTSVGQSAAKKGRLSASPRRARGEPAAPRERARRLRPFFGRDAAGHPSAQVPRAPPKIMCTTHTCQPESQAVRVVSLAHWARRGGCSWRAGWHGSRHATKDMARSRRSARPAPLHQCAGQSSSRRLCSTRAAHVQASTVSETRLRGQCRGCGHGVARWDFSGEAIGTRGGSARARTRGSVHNVDYGTTRVKVMRELLVRACREERSRQPTPAGSPGI